MIEHLHILILEDSDDDAELIAEALETENFATPRVTRARNRLEYIAALELAPDCVIADYRLPGFNGLAALELLHKRTPDTPFLLVSGTIGEELATEALHRGASDYLLKDRLNRLGHALSRALEQRDMRLESRRQNERLRELAAIVDHSNDAIIGRSLDGLITSWNPGATKMLGYTETEVIGRPLSFCLAPVQMSRLESHNKMLLEEAVLPPYESRRITKSGELVYTLITLSPVRDDTGKIMGASVIMHDITDRKHAEAARAQLAAIVENSNDAIISRDLNRKILSWNAAAERMFGWTGQEIIGKSITSIVPGDHKDGLDMMIKRALAGKTVEAVEAIRKHKDGRNIDVSITVSALKQSDGRATGIAFIYRDITTEKNLRREALRKSEISRLMETLARTINESENPQQAMHRCLLAIFGHGRWAAGRLAYFDPSAPDDTIRSSMWHTASPGEYNNLISASHNVAHISGTGRFIGKLVREKIPLWLPDISQLENGGRLRVATESGLRTAFAFPIIANGEVIAFMEFFSKEVTPPDELLLENISGVGSQLARLIERHWAESALRESEAQTREILEAQPECVKVVSADGSLVKMNRAGLAMLETESIEQVREHGLLKFVLPAYHPTFSKHLAEVLAGTPSKMEFQIVGLKGTRRWMEAHSTPITLPGSNATAMLCVTRDITKRKQTEERISHLSQHDALTGLPNRAVFRDRLGIAIARTSRRNEHLGILLFDLDRFKLVNDGLGLEAGDELLRQVAIRLKSTLRDVDTIARLGSNEFALLAEGIPGNESASAIAEKLGKAFTEPFIIAGSEVVTTASIGICMHPNDSGTEDPDQLIEHAETAMRQVKRDGGSNYQFFEAVPNVRRGQRLGMEMRLRQALVRGEFELHYQPKVRLQTGIITGMEALLRWNNPELGQVSPAQFIPVAEETGLIVPIGEWVLRTACAQMSAWHALGHALNIAVNLSPRQFRQKDLLGVVASVIHETGLPPECLELEITEGTAMANAEQAIKTLRLLKGLGIKLSVDDFGTGYSSLSYLKRFPIDCLKIDRSFVTDLGADDNSGAIVLATIALAKSMNLNSVAEGVETVIQRNFLTQADCDEYQGYLFSRPIPAKESTELLLNQSSPTCQLPDIGKAKRQQQADGL